MLVAEGYSFTTVTPETHKRILQRGAEGSSLRDIFGWNKRFQTASLAPSLARCLEGAGEILREGNSSRSAVRASTLDGQLFLHSGFPTADENAVFFGPDSYRFVRVIEASLTGIHRTEIKHVVDIGCGSGVGGIAARRILGPGTQLTLSDINERALAFSRVNSEINDLENVSIVLADVLDGLPSNLDLIVSNPPYLVDDSKRLYRHGGGLLGFDLSLRIAEESLQHLRPGGRLILYTGSPIIDGRDLFQDALRPLLAGPNVSAAYREVDPDVFGEELERAPYHSADRIAVVALRLVKR